MFLLHTVTNFTNSQYSTSDHCHHYYSPQSSHIGDKVIMKLKVSGDDQLTIVWTITIHGKTEVIDQRNEDYVLKDKNKVIGAYIRSYI